MVTSKNITGFLSTRPIKAVIRAIFEGATKEEMEKGSKLFWTELLHQNPGKVFRASEVVESFLEHQLSFRRLLEVLMSPES